MKSDRRPLSLALHMALLVGLAIVLCFIILGLLVQRSVLHHFNQQDADELRVVALSVEKAILGLDKFTGQTLESRLQNAVSGHHGIYFAVFDKQGLPIYTGTEPDFSPLLNNASVIKSIRADNLYKWQTGDHQYQGAILTPESLNRFIDGAKIAVAVTTDFHHDFMQNFRKTLWGLMLLAGILTIVAAWVAIRIGHRPLHRLSKEIQNIDVHNLSHRLNSDHAPEELSELIQAFNEMISHVEESFQKLSQFSADIAHELRTPITNLSTQTQVALNKDRSTEEYRDILYSSLEEYDRLSVMIRDMLWLAKTDNKQLTLEKISLNLAEEIKALTDYFEPLAEEKQVPLKVSGDAVMAEVDRTMFRRALNNLISNAINHSPAGADVGICVTQQENQALITIENGGKKIDEKHLSRLFDRFYQTDPSRGNSQREGVGLGLAIVKSIAELHHGSIEVTSVPDKTRFMLRLPINSPNQ
ncbi:heavy metal sensor histidine kinase [Thalassolituus sp. C2-1]|uniref:heavy metal sensor histidine kinase n=1 Tax=Venatorbacter sp. C2-1 TaxID=2597518 RepID=UPI001192B0C1|nr:heavy metal sensor histidine kinase [Thalassolituus sp. C2-1]TVV42360.1 heavy metal sensor histidine kinase [Thalassolituus sp. C2-1]